MWISKRALQELLRDQRAAFDSSIKALETHVDILLSQNAELHDRIMAKDYKEFAIERVGRESIKQARDMEQEYETEEHLVGEIVSEREV